MREFAGAAFGVSREELGKWNGKGIPPPIRIFLGALGDLAVQILLGVGCGVVRELLVVP
jgi:hypothetical protein